MMSEPKKSSGGIHPSAVVEDGASIAPDVTIGPFSVVGKNVSIASGSVLHSHVVVDGHTSIGEKTEVFPFASLGSRPQDLKYSGRLLNLS